IVGVHDALSRLADPALLATWREALERVLSLGGVHGLVAGRVARLLLDSSVIDAEAAGRHLSAALSRGTDPASGAAWVEGFLRDSGTLLVHDAMLWSIVDGWLSGLSADAFDAVLPLLRRTVATFSTPECRRLGERARSESHGAPALSVAPADVPFDFDRAAAVLPAVLRLLGLAQ
ncbi:MAG: DUF5682 family protein, partial [Solirubrobacteraceae bacterium]